MDNIRVGSGSCKKLHDDNACNRTLLEIVARGNAIITELQRLIESVPTPYKHIEGDSSVGEFLDREGKFTYEDVIYDFSYFEDPRSHEDKIEASTVLKKIDEEFCDNFIGPISRFYLTFESIQKYSSDLNNFIVQLEEGSFVGQSLDGLLLGHGTRQLLCEAYFLLGYMMIITDNHFNGGLRERLIVSYYRYSSYKSSPGSSLDETCNLMRSTGFRSLQQQVYRTCHDVQFHRPVSYPESFLSRLGVNQSVVSLLIAKLQSTDLYDQSVLAFPHPDHRSMALSRQASMLYVILYFCPDILHNQRARMREIADKFFCDNWVISMHIGELVNLNEAWAPYKAAKEALGQLIEVESIRTLINQNNLKFHRVSKHLQEYLKEGWLDERSVLENHVHILNLLREANVVLRWVILHSQLHSDWQSKSTYAMYSIVVKALPKRDLLFKFLRFISELEKKFTEICDTILLGKSKRIEDNRTRASETLNDLIDIFSDAKPMRWIQVGANSKLVDLLTEFSSNLSDIKFDQVNARDLIINLVNDLENAQESYLTGRNLQTIQLFIDTKESLMLILNLVSLTDDVKISLHSISDLSYAWKVMDVTFTAHMQAMIKDYPLKVKGIESIFLKLASGFDIQMLRLRQINSGDDLIGVSQYYSKKLVSYMRDVLHIIPTSILELVSTVISIQTDHFTSDMPAKVSLDNLKDYALPEKRFQMLELTYKISHYAESMLMMQNTTLGTIRMNSKQLLEDGIRRELVRRMSDSIHHVVQQSKLNSQTMTISQQAQVLSSTLNRLNVIMNGYKSSFSYLQDYLFIYGLRMWQEELGRIIKFNAELATEQLLREWCPRHKGYQVPTLINNSSIYQSSTAPIPVYGSDASQSSFIALVLNDILRITDPRATIYDEQLNAWYDQKPPHNRIADLEVFELIVSSLSVTGLNSIDQLCCSLALIELQKLDTFLINIYSSSSLQGHSLVSFNVDLQQKLQSSDGGKSIEKSLSSALIKMTPHSETVVSHLLRIGQLQAIRSSISCVLSTKCRYEARNIYNSLSTLNNTLLSNIRYNLGQLSSQQTGANLDFPKNEQDINDIASEDSRSSIDSWEAAVDMETSGYSDSHDVEDSQLTIELANHLDWIGLSDPLSKVYTLTLQASESSQVNEFREKFVAVDLLFLVLLGQSSKFQFSRSINGFLPKLSRSFYEASHNVDGQPLFYGLMTLLNHYDPFLSKSDDEAPGAGRHNRALNRLLDLMSSYAKWSLIKGGHTPKYSDLNGETTNMVLSLLELIRLARRPANELLADVSLPTFIFDTFQFNACHLNSNLSK